MITKEIKTVLLEVAGLSNFVRRIRDNLNFPTIDIDALLSIIIDVIVYYPEQSVSEISEYLVANGLISEEIHSWNDFYSVSEILFEIDPLILELKQALDSTIMSRYWEKQYVVDYKRTLKDKHVLLTYKPDH